MKRITYLSAFKKGWVTSVLNVKITEHTYIIHDLRWLYPLDLTTDLIKEKFTYRAKALK